MRPYKAIEGPFPSELHPATLVADVLIFFFNTSKSIKPHDVVESD